PAMTRPRPFFGLSGFAAGESGGAGGGVGCVIALACQTARQFACLMTKRVNPMSPLIISVDRIIDAPPQAIFEVLADPALHAVIDGSGSVRKPLPAAPKRLALGEKFGMDMKIGLPYRITNTVVEFDEPRRIAWQHFGKHIWCYELEPVEGGTRVTETFDGTHGRSRLAYGLMGVERKHPVAMARTLERLDRYVTTGSAE
ncbi:MAG: SRPBCC family protein, partial [Actinomycetes bacterium]